MDADGGSLPPRPDVILPQPGTPPRWGRRILLILGVIILIPFVVAFWQGFIEGFQEGSDSARSERAEPLLFSEHRLSFTVPAELDRLQGAAKNGIRLNTLPGVPSPTEGEWFEAFVLDGSNMLLVYPDELPWLVEEGNVRAHAKVTAVGTGDALGRSLDVIPTTIAGYPAVEVEENVVETPDAGTAVSRIFEVIDGNTAYGFLCQFTESRRLQMTEACDAVRDSLSIQPIADPLSVWTDIASGLGHSIRVPPGWEGAAPVSGGLIYARLQMPGDPALIADVELIVDRFLRSMTPHRYGNIIARGLERHYKLRSRTVVQLPSGSAERLVFRDRRTSLVIFASTNGLEGVGLLFSTSSDVVDNVLMRPTAEAIARSLEFDA